jgi:predicted enzyme related to lactoylglutathione lyase
LKSHAEQETTMSTGKFVWYDYQTGDVDRALAFYPETVGWKTEEWEGSSSDSPYTMFTVDGQAIGGVMELPEQARESGAPPHWQAYVTVEDIEEAFERARELGAGVHAPIMNMEEVGRMAVLTDPQGAAFAIYESAEDNPATLSPDTPGAVSWHELYTTDLEGAWDFYTELFGWEKTDSMDMGEMGEYRMYGHNPDFSYGGFMRKPDEFPRSAWLYYFTVENMDDAVSRVESHGGTLINGPHDVPGGGKTAQFTDDQGGMFAFYQLP